MDPQHEDKQHEHDLQKHRDKFQDLVVRQPAGWGAVVGQLARLKGAELAMMSIASIAAVTLYRTTNIPSPILLAAIGAITVLGIVRTFRRD